MEKRQTTIFGLQFQIDYDYLKSTDFNWLFTRLRHEVLTTLVESHSVSTRALRGLRLPFEVERAQTGRSIILDIFPLIGLEGWGAVILAELVALILYDLFRRWMDRRERGDRRPPAFVSGRRNLRRVAIRVIRKEVGPRGERIRETTLEEEEEIEWRL